MFPLMILLICGADAKLQPPKPAMSIEMKGYIIRTAISLPGVYETIGVIGANQEHVTPLVDYLLKYKNVDAVLIASNPRLRRISYNEKTKLLFCFVNTVSDIKSMVAYMKSVRFFEINGLIQFIIGKKVSDKSWLLTALEYIWEHGMLNYVVVFQIASTVEVIGYNPFSKALYNFTDRKAGSTLYPDKLEDMHGYELRVGMMYDTIKNKVIAGELLGEDVKRARDFCRMQNATLNLTFYTSLPAIKEDIWSDLLDFSTTQSMNFQKNPWIINPSHPIAFDYVAIAVPTPGLRPSTLYLWNVFNWKVWISVFTSLIIIIGFKYAFGRATGFNYDSSVSQSISPILAIFLQIPYDPMNKARSSLRIFFMTWTIYSFLITVAFNTTLRGSLLTPKYKQGIRNINELKRSDLKVLTDAAMVKQLGLSEVLQPIQNNLLYTNNTFLLEALQKHEKTYGFLYTESYLDVLTKIKDSSKRFVYQMLPERFSSGHSVYNFPEQTPYASKFRRYLFLDGQFGFSKFGLPSAREKVFGTGEHTKMSLKHLESVFMLFAFGNFVALLVFVLEKVYWKIKAPKRK